jgi:outer membrane protein assembly factor BamB
MIAYPTLKRWLAAGLTLFVIGVPLGYWIYRGGNVANPIDSPVHAQGSKANGDWTMYGGNPTRNMVNTTVKGLPSEWDVDKKTNIKWVANLGSKAYGGPIVTNGRVIIGTNNQGLRDPKEIKPKLDQEGKPVIDKKTGKPVMEPKDYGVLMCFEEATGKFQYQVLHPKLPGGQEIDWPLEGLCSTPQVDGDRMYYVTNSCKVVCADIATGKEKWVLDMIKELEVFPHNISDNSPLLIGDYLWVVTSNGVNKDHLNVPAPKAPSFIKVDKSNGKVLWKDNSPSAALLNPANVQQKDFFKNLVNRGQLIQHGQWSNAAYSKELDQVIFPGGDGWIYSFDQQGNLIWKFDCNPKDAKYALKTGERSDFIATPVIYKNRVYIGVGQDPEHKFGIGHLWCIDMEKATAAKGDVSPEIVTNDKVFPPETKANPNSAKKWHYGGLLPNKALEQKLKRLWYFGRTMSTCAIHEDILYISDLDGVLHCLNANTGEPYWEHNCDAEIWSSPYYADGKIFLGTDEGIIHVLQHGKAKKVLGQIDMGGRVRATPIAANGVLYVMTENKLYAIKAK